jgi:hypothetical protein
MRVRYTLLLLCSIALTSCSVVRLAYDNADYLLEQMVRRYVDLDRAQGRVLKVQVVRFHAWHRHEELPRYAAVLDEAAGRLERGPSRDDVLWAVQAVRTRFRVLQRQAAQDLTPLLLSLSERQVDQLEARFAADDRAFRKDRLPKDQEDAVQGRAHWLCDRLEDWTGDLNRGQRERVVAFVRAFPEVPELRLEDRERRQAQLLRLLRERREPDAGAQLVAIASEPDLGRGQRYREAMDAWEARFVDVMTEVGKSLTPRQRTTAVAQMRRYAQDFRDLAREGARRDATVSQDKTAG